MGRPASGPSDAATPGLPALALAGLSALLASSCCVLPLLLALLGVSGAWMGRLRLLAPVSPLLIGLSLAALAYAGWRLYRPLPAGSACAPGDARCADRRRGARLGFWAVALLALVPVVVPLLAPLFY